MGVCLCSVVYVEQTSSSRGHGGAPDLCGVMQEKLAGGEGGKEGGCRVGLGERQVGQGGHPWTSAPTGPVSGGRTLWLCGPPRQSQLWRRLCGEAKRKGCKGHTNFWHCITHKQTKERS